MVGEDGEEDGPGSFGHASVWGRISVVAAGPIFKFYSCICVCIGHYECDGI